MVFGQSDRDGLYYTDHSHISSLHSSTRTVKEGPSEVGPFEVGNDLEKWPLSAIQFICRK